MTDDTTTARLDNLALGAMMFGTTLNEQTSFALLDRYVDAGGSWIDTADCYAFWADPSGFGGQSEQLLGRWLAARPGVRDRVRIATKVGCECVTPNSWPEVSEGLAPRRDREGRPAKSAPDGNRAHRPVLVAPRRP